MFYVKRISKTNLTIKTIPIKGTCFNRRKKDPLSMLNKGSSQTYFTLTGSGLKHCEPPHLYIF